MAADKPGPIARNRPFSPFSVRYSACSSLTGDREVCVKARLIGLALVAGILAAHEAAALPIINFQGSTQGCFDACGSFASSVSLDDLDFNGAANFRPRKSSVV